MSNPLQPRCIKLIEEEFNGYVINITAASKSGHMDLIACINGLFYGFEIKWKTDRPSSLQIGKINACIDAGGRAYFIKTVEQLRLILKNNIPPEKYETGKTKFSL